MDTKLTDLFPLEEGINDPAIFKAVFLAGGPGSGKSFIVGKTALTSFGLKVVNSDDAFENALKKAGLETTPENIFSMKGQSLRDRASKLTKMRQDSYLNGRLGLVIDGTGKDFEKIRKQKIELEKLGYQTAMILVNTNLDTAVGRDKKRARTLGKAKVEPMWRAVQNNIGKFQNLFGNEFIVVDNSDGANYEGGIMSAYRKIGQWTRTPPSNRNAQRWIRDQKQKRNITKESVPDDENYIDEACWVGWKSVSKDVEQVDEVSKKMLHRYQQKNETDREKAVVTQDVATIKKRVKGDRLASKKIYTDVYKRHGLSTAKVPATNEEVELEEKIEDMEMGEVIKDFQKSDAPQFKGKSKKKRREMAIAAKLQSQEEELSFTAEDLRKWFGKGPKGDWVRVGTDGEIKGDCAREPGEGKPKCMPRSKAHSMDKDDRATSARRKRRKDPVADRKGKGGKPVMVKTDVEEGKNHSWKSEGHYTIDGEEWTGMQHAYNGQIFAGAEHTDDSQRLYHYKELPKAAQDKVEKKHEVKENNLEEMPRWALPALAKTVHKAKYDNAKKSLIKLLNRKKKEGGGRLKHSAEYYAQQIQRSTRGMDKVDPRILAKMVAEEYKYEWGTPEATAYMKALTPGEPGETTKKNKNNSKYHYKAKKIVEDRKEEEEAAFEVLEMDVDSIFTPQDVADMEIQIDNMDFDDLVDLDMYDEDELEYIDFEDEDDIHDEIQITEVLSIQGRMKRRFAARRNRQKLKVARMRAARRASDPGRLKRRATRGARNMIKNRIARGRDIQSLPPAEKARIEAMAKRFSGLVSRMATRLAPIVRRNELKRLTSRNKKPMKAKKYNPARAKAAASKQKAKKFKVKKK